MLAIQILGRGIDQVWSEFALLVGACLVLVYAIRRDASQRVTCLVIGGVVLVWLGDSAGSASRLLLLAGVLALATAGYTAISRFVTHI